MNAATMSLNAVPGGAPLLLSSETSSIPQTRPTTAPTPFQAGLRTKPRLGSFPLSPLKVVPPPLWE